MSDKANVHHARRSRQSWTFAQSHLANVHRGPTAGSRWTFAPITGNGDMTVADRSAQETIRTRLRVRGTVQGVGFRPFVYRLAHDEALAGYVLNDERGVLIEVEGPARSVERLLARLGAEVPALAPHRLGHPGGDRALRSLPL